MKKVIKILVVTFIILNTGKIAAGSSWPDVWRYNIISSDAVMATAGSEFWMIQTGADYRITGMWSGGARCFYWEQRQDGFRNVYAVDGHIAQRVISGPVMRWEISTGAGVAGSVWEGEEQPFTPFLSAGTELDLHVFPTVFFGIRGTWMLARDGSTTPFWGGIQTKLSSMVWLGAGLAGVHTMQWGGESHSTWHVAPAVRFSIWL